MAHQPKAPIIRPGVNGAKFTVRPNLPKMNNINKIQPRMQSANSNQSDLMSALMTQVPSLGNSDRQMALQQIVKSLADTIQSTHPEVAEQIISKAQGIGSEQERSMGSTGDFAASEIDAQMIRDRACQLEDAIFNECEQDSRCQKYKGLTRSTCDQSEVSLEGNPRQWENPTALVVRISQANNQPQMQQQSNNNQGNDNPFGAFQQTRSNTQHQQVGKQRGLNRGASGGTAAPSGRLPQSRYQPVYQQQTAAVSDHPQPSNSGPPSVNPLIHKAGVQAFGAAIESFQPVRQSPGSGAPIQTMADQFSEELPRQPQDDQRFEPPVEITTAADLFSSNPEQEGVVGKSRTMPGSGSSENKAAQSNQQHIEVHSSQEQQSSKPPEMVRQVAEEGKRSKNYSAYPEELGEETKQQQASEHSFEILTRPNEVLQTELQRSQGSDLGHQQSASGDNSRNYESNLVHSNSGINASNFEQLQDKASESVEQHHGPGGGGRKANQFEREPVNGPPMKTFKDDGDHFSRQKSVSNNQTEQINTQVQQECLTEVNGRGGHAASGGNFGASSVPGLFPESQPLIGIISGRNIPESTAFASSPQPHMRSSMHTNQGSGLYNSLQPVSSSRPPMSVASLQISQLDDSNSEALIRAYKKKKAEMETLRDKFFTVETQVFQATGKLRVCEDENVQLKEQLSSVEKQLKALQMGEHKRASEEMVSKQALQFTQEQAEAYQKDANRQRAENKTLRDRLRSMFASGQPNAMPIPQVAEDSISIDQHQSALKEAELRHSEAQQRAEKLRQDMMQSISEKEQNAYTQINQLQSQMETIVAERDSHAHFIQQLNQQIEELNVKEQQSLKDQHSSMKQQLVEQEQRIRQEYVNQGSEINSNAQRQTDELHRQINELATAYQEAKLQIQQLDDGKNDLASVNHQLRNEIQMAKQNEQTMQHGNNQWAQQQQHAYATLEKEFNEAENMMNNQQAQIRKLEQQMHSERAQHRESESESSQNYQDLQDQLQTIIREKVERVNQLEHDFVVLNMKHNTLQVQTTPHVNAPRTEEPRPIQTNFAEEVKPIAKIVQAEIQEPQQEQSPVYQAPQQVAQPEHNTQQNPYDFFNESVDTGHQLTTQNSASLFGEEIPANQDEQTQNTSGATFFEYVAPAKTVAAPAQNKRRPMPQARFAAPVYTNIASVTQQPTLPQVQPTKGPPPMANSRPITYAESPTLRPKKQPEPTQAPAPVKQESYGNLYGQDEDSDEQPSSSVIPTSMFD